jgi:hypothetical protein
MEFLLCFMGFFVEVRPGVSELIESDDAFRWDIPT